MRGNYQTVIDLSKKTVDLKQKWEDCQAILKNNFQYSKPDKLNQTKLAKLIKKRLKDLHERLTNHIYGQDPTGIVIAYRSIRVIEKTDLVKPKKSLRDIYLSNLKQAKGEYLFNLKFHLDIPGNTYNFILLNKERSINFTRFYAFLGEHSDQGLDVLEGKDTDIADIMQAIEEVPEEWPKFIKPLEYRINELKKANLISTPQNEFIKIVLNYERFRISFHEEENKH